MIRINLLPSEIEKRAVAQRRTILIASAVVAVLLVFVGIYFMRLAKITTLKGELKKLTAEHRKYEKDLKKINEMESQKAALQNKLNVINELMGSRLDYPKMMEILTRKDVIPGKVWLKSFSSQGTGKIKLTLDLEAMDNYAVADFLANLEKSPRFDNIKINGFSPSSSGDKKTRVFGISCDYKPERGKKNG
ncbi:MAG: PilN domain-containing protein [Elusimicrobia bacterium]|nr:PilN domain-containing protein [Elusimicrobiota bacterium]